MYLAGAAMALLNLGRTESERRRYEEEDAKNIYGEGIDRVSTILSLWNNDPEEKLMDWAASKGHGWRPYRAECARIGTATHEMIESDCNAIKARQSWETIMQMSASALARQPLAIRETVQRCYAGWVQWVSRFNRFDVIAAEETIIHDGLKVGGTCDLKAIVDYGEGPKRIMCDWKTSSGFHLKQRVQLSAYDILHKYAHPEDPPFDYYGIVRFDRRRGGFEELWFTPDVIVKDSELFLSLVALKKAQNALAPLL